MEVAKKHLETVCTDWVVKGQYKNENQIRFSENSVDINKNWEEIKKYYTAWWNCEVLDKVAFEVRAPLEKHQQDKTLIGSSEDRLNKEKVIDIAEKKIQNTFYGGLAFPQYWPNFGPDIFSAYMGATLEFSPLGDYPVSWVDWKKPVLKDYSDLSALEIKEDNLYWQKTKEFTSYALERARGNRSEEHTSELQSH